MTGIEILGLTIAWLTVLGSLLLVLDGTGNLSYEETDDE
jgi:hypothetical protein